MSNASRALRDLGADGADADQAEGVAFEHVELRGVPAFRGLGDPRVGQALREREHRRQHPLRDRHRAGAARAREHPLAHQVEREPVDAGAERVDPFHAGRDRPTQRFPVVRERGEDLHLGGALVGRVDDDLALAESLLHPSDEPAGVEEVDRDRGLRGGAAGVGHTATVSFRTPTPCTLPRFSCR